MRMESEIIGNVLILTPLDRRIEAASSASFKGVMVDWINQGHARIVLDLSNVDFVDSSGLGAIISVLKRLGDEGTLALCQIRKPVLGLFKLTRMDRVFRIFDKREQAVGQLVAP